MRPYAKTYPHLFKRNLEIIVEGDRFDCYVDADNLTTDRDGNKIFTPNATNPWLFLKSEMNDITGGIPDVTRHTPIPGDFKFDNGDPYQFVAAMCYFVATWPCNPQNPRIMAVSGAELGFGTIEYAYRSLNTLIAYGWNQNEESGFRNFWDGKFEAGNEKIAGTVVTTNRTSFACSNSCGDAKKFKNLFNLLFTGQGFKCDGEKVSLPPLAGNDIEAILDFIILDLMPQLPFGHAPSPFSSNCGAVDPNSGGAESGVVGDLWLSYKVRNQIGFRKSQELINEYVMREYNMLGEVDKMAAWSTAMNARLRDPLKLYEQKALAYDSEEGWENFKTCLGGKRKKRLSRRRGIVKLDFRKGHSNSGGRDFCRWGHSFDALKRSFVTRCWFGGQFQFH